MDISGASLSGVAISTPGNVAVIDESLRLWVDFTNPNCYPWQTDPSTNLSTGTNYIKDLSGYTDDDQVRTVSNLTWNSAGYFSHSNDYWRIGYNYAGHLNMGTDSFTIEGYASRTGNSSSDSYGGAIAGKGSWSNASGYSIYMTDSSGSASTLDAIGFQYRQGSTAIGLSTSASYISNSTWYHVVGVRDVENGIASLYVNGVLITTESDNSSINVNIGNNFTGGALNTDGGTERKFNGDIGLVRVYRRALTAGEVLANFNSVDGRYS